MALNEGDILAGKYRIERELGEGGMGAVYVATNQVLQKRVALKVMNERFASVPAAVERFLREAVAASRVSHSGIVQVFDAGEHEKKPWIAMELLEGESLGERLERGPMDVEDVLKMADGALSALAEVHEEGIIHRDLKPDNIFLARMRGGDWVPKVLDFGVAKDTSDGQLSKLTATGAVVGTAHYLSPEQAKGLADIDARADVYAMGVVLFEALSGRMPYEAETITQLIAKMFTEDPRSLHAIAPHVPKAVADVVSTCLEQDREKRFQTARALHGALRAAAEAVKGGPAAGMASNPGYAPTAVAMASHPGNAVAPPSVSGHGAFPATMVAGTPMPVSHGRGHAATTVLPSSPPPAMPGTKSGPRAGLLAVVAAVFVLGAAGTGLGAWLLYKSDGEPVTPVAHATTSATSAPSAEVEPPEPSAPVEPEVPVGVDPSELGASSDTAPASDPVEVEPTADPDDGADEDEADDSRSARRRRSRDRDAPQQTEQRPDPPPRDPPSRDPTPAPAQPGLAHAQVMSAIQSQLPRLQQRCYQPRLAQVPGLQGVVTVSWTVAGDGRAQDARVVHNGTGDATLARCTMDIVLGTSFPRASNGQPTPARYPFQFRLQ